MWGLVRCIPRGPAPKCRWWQPAWEHEFREHQIKGRLYNTYGHGGYLIWHLWPDIPVFIDGRTPTIYDDDFFWLYVLAEQNKEIWQKVVKEYGIEIVLAEDNRGVGYANLFYWLDEDEGWRLVAFDDNSNLYLKKGGRFDELIERYEFRYLRPADISLSYAKEKKDDRRYLEALEVELQEACRRYPDAFYPFYYLGIYHQIYGTEQHLLKAEEAFRQAVANRPDLSAGHYQLGFTLMKLGRYREAIEPFRRSLRYRTPPHDLYYYLGYSLFQNGKVGEAIKMLKRYKKLAGSGTRAEAYRLLADAYLQVRQFRKAVSCYKRWGYLKNHTWETLVNMGVAYYALNDLQKARDCFQEAVRMEPQRLKSVYNLAVVCEKLGETELAVRLFSQAAKMHPADEQEEMWQKKAQEKVR